MDHHHNFVESPAVPGSLPEVPRPDVSANAGSTPTVVLIEDEAPIAEIASWMLEDAGFKVIWRERGGDGLAAVRQCRPAVVILDLMLPDMKGQDVLRALKSDETTAPVPVVIASAVASLLRDDEVALAHAVIAKPFTVAELVEAVQQASLLQSVATPSG